jgi:DNA (cytosine-5)-methyltransferase 1
MEEKRRNITFSFIDLFAGIGGTRTAFEQAGGRCVYSSEWDRNSQKTYQANFGEIPDGDIRAVKKERIPNHDILVAGFPCQPFSIAGVSKKISLGRKHGFEDVEQGNLFFEIAEVLRVKRPKAFLLENVKNLKSHDKGNTFRVISETLTELGYTIFSEVLDGRHYVPQHRERIFVAGFRQNRFPGITFTFPAPPKKDISVADILERKVDDKYTLSDKLWNYLQQYARKHREKGNGFGFGLIDPTTDRITRTLSARYHKDGSEILIKQRDKNPRRLTPGECARLMGFPAKFKIVVSDTQAYRQFGNSVIVPLVAAVARQVVSALKQYGHHLKTAAQPQHGRDKREKYPARIERAPVFASQRLPVSD